MSGVRSLRYQIEELARDTFGARLASVWSFPQNVSQLAIRAFEEQWPESASTRAVRRALHLFKNVGWVRDDEMEVS